MNCKLTGTSSYWCGSCGCYVAGELDTTRVLDGDHEDGTTEQNIEWCDVTMGDCGHYESEDGEIFPPELISGHCWKCQKCGMTWGGDHKSARLCCTGNGRYEHKASKNGRYAYLTLIPKKVKEEAKASSF